MKRYPWFRTAPLTNRGLNLLSFIRPVGALILTILLFVTPVSADTVVLTLDEDTIPDTLQCGEIWNEAGLDLILLPHPPACFVPELCVFFSNPDHLGLFPGILNVDLTGIEGTVVSAVAVATFICSDCVKAVFYDGTTVVDSAFGSFGDTLEVFTSGMPVDRFAMEVCYEARIHEIRIEYDPTPTGIKQPDYARGVQLQPHPNPFNAWTQISFDLETGGWVQLLIYDAKGRLVRSLVDTEWGAGHRAVAWDGRGASGRRLPTGVYFARLTVDGRVAAARKVVIAR